MSSGKIIWKGTKNQFFAEENSTVSKTVLGIPLENFKEKRFSSPDKTAGKKTVLRVNNLDFSYGGRQVLRNITFSLQEGTLTALTGASGSGKSTLLELLSGLKQQDGGTIRCAQKPLLCQQNSDSALFETFAADDVAFGPKNKGIRGNELIERVETAMNTVSLPFAEFASRQTCCLSGGEKRRLSIAGIIAMQGDILLFDEPSAGLDGEAKYNIMHLLRKLAESGKTVLFTTHHHDEALFADDTLILEEARLISPEPAEADGTADSELKEQLSISGIFSAAHLTKLNEELSKNEKPRKGLQKLPAVLKYMLFITFFTLSVTLRPLALCAAFLPAAAVYAVASGCRAKKLFRSMIKIIPFLLFFCIFEMIFAPQAADDIIFLPYTYFLVTASKLRLCLRILLHTECALCCILAFSAAATENDIIKGFSALLAPFRILRIPIQYPVILMEITFRFIPLLIDEAVSIIKIQLVRGGLSEQKGFLRKIQAVIPLIVPLIIQTVRRAEILADALTTRGLK